MSTNVQIRRAEVGDVEVISSLAKITFSETFGHYFRDPKDLLDYFKRTFSEEKILGSIRKPHNVFWLALVNNAPVGYSKLKLNSASKFISEENSSQLQKIYILKNFLSMKVGLKLQDEMLKEAKERGSNVIWLSVLNENERAIRFYTKTGFQMIGEHDFQIGKESFQFHVMSKLL